MEERGAGWKEGGVGEKERRKNEDIRRLHTMKPQLRILQNLRERLRLAYTLQLRSIVPKPIPSPRMLAPSLKDSRKKVERKNAKARTDIHSKRNRQLQVREPREREVVSSIFVHWRQVGGGITGPN